MVTRLLRNSFLLLSASVLLIPDAHADVYTVRPGDNLTVIARRLGIPLKTLAHANSVRDNLKPGQKIRIPDAPRPAARKSASHKSASHKSASRSSSQAADSAKEKARRKKALLARKAAEKQALIARKKKQARLESQRNARLLKQKLAKAKKKRDLAAWQAHLKRLHKKRLLAAKAERAGKLAAQKRRVAQEKALKKKRQAAMAAKASLHRRGQVRRDYKDLPEATRRLAKKEGSSQGGSSSAHNKIVRTAMAYRGARYVFGASGGGSFDCSGFTRHVYRRVLGVDLPHSSREQYGYGRSVSRSELKPGDLLFFHTDRPGISHVGIYIGNGRFVHAANPRRGVTTDSLSSSYYGSRYVGAKRIRH